MGVLEWLGYGGQDSEYYFRKFRKIKTRTNVIEIDDYETYKLSLVRIHSVIQSLNLFLMKISIYQN
jgi:hypothetical protein